MVRAFITAFAFTYAVKPASWSGFALLVAGFGFLVIVQQMQRSSGSDSIHMTIIAVLLGGCWAYIAGSPIGSTGARQDSRFSVSRVRVLVGLPLDGTVLLYPGTDLASPWPFLAKGDARSGSLVSVACHRGVEAYQGVRCALRPDRPNLGVDSFRLPLLGTGRRPLKQFLRNHSSPAVRDWLSAILLGERWLLPADVQEQYRRMGLSHLLVVSGYHVGLMLTFTASLATGMIGWLSPRIGGNRLRVKANLQLWAVLSSAFMVLLLDPGIAALRALLLALCYVLVPRVFNLHSRRVCIELALCLQILCCPSTVVTKASFLSWFGFLIVTNFKVSAAAIRVKILHLFGRQILFLILVWWVLLEWQPFGLVANLILAPLFPLVFLTIALAFSGSLLSGFQLNWLADLSLELFHALMSSLYWGLDRIEWFE